VECRDAAPFERSRDHIEQIVPLVRVLEGDDERRRCALWRLRPLVDMGASIRGTTAMPITLTAITVTEDRVGAVVNLALLL
jgi:hypothetical protein